MIIQMRSRMVGIILYVKYIFFYPSLRDPSNIQIQTLFNLTIPDDLVVYDVFLFNKGQMYIPSSSNIFGSDYVTITRPFTTEKKYSYYYSYSLKRVQWKTIDHEYLRCDDKQAVGSTSECLTSFLEGRVGCSMQLQGSKQHLNL